MEKELAAPVATLSEVGWVVTEGALPAWLIVSVAELLVAVLAALVTPHV
jgi:hypothetical protein